VAQQNKIQRRMNRCATETLFMWRTVLSAPQKTLILWRMGRCVTETLFLWRNFRGAWQQNVVFGVPLMSLFPTSVSRMYPLLSLGNP
jgi:hypothetical protein